MVKSRIIPVMAYSLILLGCVSTMKTGEQKEPVPKITVGMNSAEVIKILNHPDFTSSSEGQPIFFYCTYFNEDHSKGTCTPIFFQDDKVVYVGEKDSQKWNLDTVRFKVEQERRTEIVTKERKKEKEKIEEKRGAIRSDRIAVETLTAQKPYTPNQGDTVYINYYTNFVRYIPLRSNPSENGEVLKTLCLGSELGVLSVQDQWLYVEGVDEVFKGWILKRWVTNDRTVKIDAEKMRRERAPEIARLEAIVKPIPRSKWKRNLELYEQLLALDPCNLFYQRKVDFYENYGGKGKKRKRK